MAKIELLNVDCMDYMRSLPDKAFDLAIVDPQYGIGEHGGKNRGKGVRQHNGTVIRVNHPGYEDKGWDTEPPPPEYFTELQRVTKAQILWGANHYSDRLPRASSGWIVWDKVNTGDFSDCELAWTSFSCGARLYAHMWNGMMQGSPHDGRKQQGNKALNEKRIHPTQKPVALYRWLLENYAKPGQRILDTHGGSMSIAIACEALGFDLTLCEIDKDYYEAGVKRFETWKAQPLFDDIPAPVQAEIAYEAQDKEENT
jgi:site-specific DNA-methyltransferase (adenine-specific)